MYWSVFQNVHSCHRKVLESPWILKSQKCGSAADSCFTCVFWWQVKKLVHENRLLRCGYSPVDIPPSVNGHEAPRNDGVGCGRPARWSLVESSDSRRHFAVGVCLVVACNWSRDVPTNIVAAFRLFNLHVLWQLNGRLVAVQLLWMLVKLDTSNIQH